MVTVNNVPLALTPARSLVHVPPGNAVFYELLKGVNRRLALLDAFFILVATAVETAGVLNPLAPLVLLGDENQDDRRTVGSPRYREDLVRSAFPATVM